MGRRLGTWADQNSLNARIESSRRYFAVIEANAVGKNGSPCMRKATRVRGFGRAPFVAAFGPAFADRFNPVFGEVMLQEGRVEVAPAVFVADGEDGGWGLGAGG